MVRHSSFNKPCGVGPDSLTFVPLAVKANLMHWAQLLPRLLFENWDSEQPGRPVGESSFPRPGLWQAGAFPTQQRHHRSEMMSQLVCPQSLGHIARHTWGRKRERVSPQRLGLPCACQVGEAFVKISAWKGPVWEKLYFGSKASILPISPNRKLTSRGNYSPRLPAKPGVAGIGAELCPPAPDGNASFQRQKDKWCHPCGLRQELCWFRAGVSGTLH